MIFLPKNDISLPSFNIVFATILILVQSSSSQILLKFFVHPSVD